MMPTVRKVLLNINSEGASVAIAVAIDLALSKK